VVSVRITCAGECDGVLAESAPEVLVASIEIALVMIVIAIGVTAAYSFWKDRQSAT
jgi:hypothetical protein